MQGKDSGHTENLKFLSDLGEALGLVCGSATCSVHVAVARLQPHVPCDHTFCRVLLDPDLEIVEIV